MIKRTVSTIDRTEIHVQGKHDLGRLTNHNFTRFPHAGGFMYVFVGAEHQYSFYPDGDDKYRIVIHSRDRIGAPAPITLANMYGCVREWVEVVSV